METKDIVYSGLCLKHNLEFEFYCVTCKQMVCKKCITDHSKNNDQFLYLEDYGKQTLLTAFDDITAELKKNSEEIDASPVQSKKSAGDLIEVLKTLKTNLSNTISSLDQEIAALSVLKESNFILPNAEELIRIIGYCRKSLETEVKKSTGIAHAIEIIQSTKELLNGLTSNTLSLRKLKEQIVKVDQELPFTPLLQAVKEIRSELRLITKNKMLDYSARVGIPITSKCIYGIKEQSNTLLSYNLETKVIKKVSLPINIPEEPVVTQIEDRVYLTGGGNYLSSNIEYVESTEHTTDKKEMGIGRKWHSTIVLNGKEFVSLGGYSNVYKHLNMCEKYNCEKDEWTAMPSLNEFKQSVAACLLEKKEIYVFGGYSGARHKSVEYLDLDHEVDGWKIVKVEEEMYLPPFSCGAAFQISTFDILLLRGNSTREVFIFNTREKIIRKGQTLKHKDSFLLQNLYPIKGAIAGLGYYGSIHLFDFKSQTWEDAEYVIG